jgi:RNA polymerase sigma-70 factor (ECF subfamily)
MPDPLGEVWEHHHAAVRRFARHLSGSASQADDLTQEAFVRLWTTSSTIRTETVRAYLFTIVRHEFLRWRRRRWRFVDADEDVVDAGIAPDERAVQLQQLRRVREALAALDDDDRAALWMRADGDLSYEDIAASLGISVGAARVRVHRARRRLLETSGVSKGAQP